jgi:hypothetical protein
MSEFNSSKQCQVYTFYVFKYEKRDTVIGEEICFKISTQKDEGFVPGKTCDSLPL